MTMFRFRMESSVNKLISALQCGHLTRSARDGDTWASPSQARHLKCIIGAMKGLLAILLFAASVQAQSIAEIARQERERQAHLKPAQVITGTGSGASVPGGPPAAAAQKAEEPKKAAADPVKEYNDQIDKLRTKIRALQDEETATQLQISELNNQVYASVVDPVAKDQAMAAVGAAQMKLADIRKELGGTTRAFEALQAQGPPKK
jgi:hypothetical protein